MIKILVLHLSDIHIRPGKEKNIILDRIEGIANVVNEHAQDLSVCFVVISGDIALSGNSEEYSVAVEFFNFLQKRIESMCPGLSLKYVMVPGNHDCNFQNDDQMRRILIHLVPQDMKSLTDYSVINKCTSIQEASFDFIARFSDIKDFRDATRIHYRQQFSIGDYKICFNCFNTSWMSQEKEKQGQIFFPIDLITTAGEQFDLVLSVFHHTYNWLEVSNGKLFRKHIERNSDIVLTGHEHDLGYAIQENITGDINQYVEGGILQEEDNGENSEFNVLIVDLQGEKEEVLQYEWIRDMYSKKNGTGWFPLTRGTSLHMREFANNGNFDNYLHDPGISLMHPRKGYLDLDDIFLWPDLKEIHATGEFPFAMVRSSDCNDYVRNNAKIAVFGADKSGKTTFAKKAYLELLRQGMVPVLIDGASIKSGEKEGYVSLAKKAFSEQYDQKLLEKYGQLQRRRRTVLIDDFDRAGLNIKGKAHFIDALADFAERIIVFNEVLYRFEELLVQKEGTNPFLEFSVCEMMPFGRVLREKMIERWLTLGQEYTVDQRRLVYNIDRIGKAVNTILRTHVLPSYPVFVLIILQTIEANIPAKTVMGSYGYLYDFLIARDLARTGYKPSLEAKLTYLSELAYHMFSNSLTELTKSDMEDLGERYRENYGVRIQNERMIGNFIKSQILATSGDSYRFTYDYIYYYFVARYIPDNMKNKGSEERMKGHVTEMSKEVFREDYANIIIFLSYLSRDPFIIGEMLGSAKKIYKDYALCDLEQDVEFLGKMSISTRSIVLPDKDVRERREERLTMEDDMEMFENDVDRRSGSGDEIPTDIMQINSAFKTLDILGQIVRNFSGSLRADLKLTMIEECYSIGLRTLKFVLSILEANLDEVKEVLSGFLKDSRGIKDRRKLEKRTEEFTVMLVQGISYGIIKKISYSAGCEELRELYEKVLDKYNLKSVSMIDMSVKLDHFGELPMYVVKEIMDFHEQIKNNIFLAEMLRLMVAEYFYMFPVDYNKRQTLGTKLDITYDKPMFMHRKSRKFK